MPLSESASYVTFVPYANWRVYTEPCSVAFESGSPSGKSYSECHVTPSRLDGPTVHDLYAHQSPHWCHTPENDCRAPHTSMNLLHSHAKTAHTTTLTKTKTTLKPPSCRAYEEQTHAPSAEILPRCCTDQKHGKLPKPLVSHCVWLVRSKEPAMNDTPHQRSHHWLAMQTDNTKCRN